MSDGITGMELEGTERKWKEWRLALNYFHRDTLLDNFNTEAQKGEVFLLLLFAFILGLGLRLIWLGLAWLSGLLRG